mmetsp:Transcript_93428/g.204494  ORF Transcript_93428/g.204494 Transcript_93428/m.204494 type:complete len:96 (+) Transcript_93428:212-499(+)
MPGNMNIIAVVHTELVRPRGNCSAPFKASATTTASPTITPELTTRLPPRTGGLSRPLVKLASAALARGIYTPAQAKTSWRARAKRAATAKRLLLA